MLISKPSIHVINLGDAPADAEMDASRGTKVKFEQKSHQDPKPQHGYDRPSSAIVPRGKQNADRAQRQIRSAGTSSHPSQPVYFTIGTENMRSYPIKHNPPVGAHTSGYYAKIKQTQQKVIIKEKYPSQGGILPASDIRKSRPSSGRPLSGRQKSLGVDKTALNNPVPNLSVESPDVVQIELRLAAFTDIELSEEDTMTHIKSLIRMSETNTGIYVI